MEVIANIYRWRGVLVLALAVTLLALVLGSRYMARHQQASRTIFIDATHGDDANAERGHSQKPFRTLAEAVNAARDGDVIQFHPGVYPQPAGGVTIARPLTIRGPGARLLAAGRDHWVLNIAADDVTLDGLEIDGARGDDVAPGTRYSIDSTGHSRIRMLSLYVHGSATGAIRITGNAADCEIRGCRFADNFAGIYTDMAAGASPPGPTRLIVTNNEFEGGFTNAPHSGAMKFHTNVPYKSRFHIADNSVSGPGEMGIEIYGPMTHNVVEDNSIAETVFGISLGFGCDFTGLRNNICRGQTFAGYEVVQARNVTATGNDYDDRNATGQSARGVGWSVSQSLADDLNLLIEGGRYEVLNANAVATFNARGVHLKGIHVISGGLPPVNFIYVANSGIEGSTIEWSTLKPGNPFIVFNAMKSPGVVFEKNYVRNNQLKSHGVPLPQVIAFYTDNTGVFKDSTIEGNEVIGVPFCGSGFISGVFSGKTANNKPEEKTGRHQFGFVPLQR